MKNLRDFRVDQKLLRYLSTGKRFFTVDILDSFLQLLCKFKMQWRFLLRDNHLDCLLTELLGWRRRFVIDPPFNLPLNFRCFALFRLGHHNTRHALPKRRVLFR